MPHLRSTVMPDDKLFDSTMEQRLQGAMIEYLDQQRLYMIQWNQAQDVIGTANAICVLGLTVAVFLLAARVNKLEGTANVNP